MRAVHGNRAVSAMFRVFGGSCLSLQGDVVKRLAGSGAMVGEVRVLGVLIPVFVGVVTVERLAAWLGPWWAAALALPGSVLAIHVFAFGLGVFSWVLGLLGGEAERWRWRVWLVALTAWAVWAWGQGGWVQWAAAGWMVVVALELLALVLLGWQRLMRVPGRAGVVLRVVLAVLVHLPALPLWHRCGWPWAAGWIGLIIVAWARATFGPNARGFGPVLSRCDGSGVWLTIDDGPDPETTPRMLDLLDEHGVRATFFLIGEKVEAQPELAREIVARGHLLGGHTMSHPAASFWCAGPGRTRREIIDGVGAIESATGVRPRWFRAPVGHSNYFTHPVTLAEGLEVVGWNGRGLDGVSRDVPRILARLTRGMQRGDILLVHDATPVSAEVLGGLLEAMDERGLKARSPKEGCD